MALPNYVGSKYTRGLDIREVAKLVREDIKAAIATGELPKIKVSVSIDRFSGGQSLDVWVTHVPKDFKVVDSKRKPHSVTVKFGGSVGYLSERLTAPAIDMLDNLQGIVKAYNYDKSDSQSDYWDVNFYEHVGLVNELVAPPKAGRYDLIG